MTQIDFTRPLELSDGRAVKLLKQPDAGYPYIDVEIGGTLRSFTDKGKHWAFTGITLRNVIETNALDTSKPLQTTDGKPVRFLGKMDNGQLVFAITYRGYTGHDATELRYADGRKSNVPGVTSGDDVVLKITRKETYRNVYSDGTVGSTTHATTEVAALRSKYGKVRVGLLHTKFENDVVVSSAVVPVAAAWYRDASCPKGRPATPADFAR